jgi:hypothetical protein
MSNLKGDVIYLWIWLIVGMLGYHVMKWEKVAIVSLCFAFTELSAITYKTFRGDNE